MNTDSLANGPKNLKTLPRLNNKNGAGHAQLCVALNTRVLNRPTRKKVATAVLFDTALHKGLIFNRSMPIDSAT